MITSAIARQEKDSFSQWWRLAHESHKESHHRSFTYGSSYFRNLCDWNVSRPSRLCRGAQREYGRQQERWFLRFCVWCVCSWSSEPGLHRDYAIVLSIPCKDWWFAWRVVEWIGGMWQVDECFWRSLETSLVFYFILCCLLIELWFFTWCGLWIWLWGFLCLSERFFLYFNKVSECFGGNYKFYTWIAMMLNDADWKDLNRDDLLWFQ